MNRETAVRECSPREAYEAALSGGRAAIIDVRTDAEWTGVGVPDSTNFNHPVQFISWQFAPDMRLNPAFVETLKAANLPADTALYFLCRSGVRSDAAAQAAAAAGFAVCVNIVGGFEGVPGPDGRRHGGWLGDGLPASQYRSQSV